MTIYDEIYHPVKYSVVNPNFRVMICSPEFQRLGNITQTSATISKFPGSCHTRFQHCIGTSFLAHLILDRY